MEINTDMITQWGMLNKISTGHPAVDILLCMLLPVLMKHLLPELKHWVEVLITKLFQNSPPGPEEVVRTITFTEYPSKSCLSSTEDHNNRLQQAILLKVNRLPDIAKIMKEAEAGLSQKEKMALPNFGDWEESDIDEDEEWYEDKELEQYGVNLAPPDNVEINLTPTLKFMRYEAVSQQDKVEDQSRKVTFVLRCKGVDAAEVLDGWINSAYEEYKEMLRGKKHDPVRYMYMPVLSLADPTEGFTFRRYALSEDKTFDNFFHPEKDHILNLVHNFMDKGGKFAIPGYPHKLGFLLHGPPGTGKTSFIKALAQLTKRHILNVPLSRIRTNQELMDLMFAQKVQVENSYSRVPLPYDKVIYVMEDVDAASRVVHRRAPPAQATPTVAAGPATGAGGGGGLYIPANAFGHPGPALAAVAAAAGVGLGGAAAGKGGDDAASTKAHAGGDQAVKPAKDGGIALKDLPQLLGAPGGGCLDAGGGDALNLAGLLNILDGVVDTPGRLIIMTSNHPEKLDPALIRPGRINRKIFMDNLAVEQAVHMTRHYFGVQLCEEGEQRLRRLWQDHLLSPATLESMCAEHDSVEELLAALEEDLPQLHAEEEEAAALKQAANQQMKQLCKVDSTSMESRGSMRVRSRRSRARGRQGEDCHDEDESEEDMFMRRHMNSWEEDFPGSKMCGLWRRRQGVKV